MYIMECQECQQRPSTLHFTRVINGNKKEIYVCEVCARDKGYMTYPEEGYSLHNLLAGLFNFESTPIKKHQETSLKQSQQLQCPKCKLTFSEFKRIGKFGCATCYQTFSDQLNPIIRRVHSGNTKHSGKIPKRKGGSLHTKKKLEAYQMKLQHLIKKEAFEEAALIRDEIKKLKDQQHSETGDRP